MADEMREVGFRKFTADQLPAEERERLRNVLQHDLTAALIQSIKANPPDVNLADIDLILRPNQEIADWSIAADCWTCLTCWTCWTSKGVETPSDIPVDVLREINVRPQVSVDVKDLKVNIERLSRNLRTLER